MKEKPEWWDEAVEKMGRMQSMVPPEIREAMVYTAALMRMGEGKNRDPVALTRLIDLIMEDEAAARTVLISLTSLVGVLNENLALLVHQDSDELMEKFVNLVYVSVAKAEAGE